MIKWLMKIIGDDTLEPPYISISKREWNAISLGLPEKMKKDFAFYNKEGYKDDPYYQELLNHKDEAIAKASMDMAHADLRVEEAMKALAFENFSKHWKIAHATDEKGFPLYQTALDANVNMKKYQKYIRLREYVREWYKYHIMFDPYFDGYMNLSLAEKYCSEEEIEIVKLIRAGYWIPDNGEKASRYDQAHGDLIMLFKKLPTGNDLYGG